MPPSARHRHAIGARRCGLPTLLRRLLALRLLARRRLCAGRMAARRLRRGAGSQHKRRKKKQKTHKGRLAEAAEQRNPSRGAKGAKRKKSLPAGMRNSGTCRKTLQSGDSGDRPIFSKPLKSPACNNLFQLGTTPACNTGLAGAIAGTRQDRHGRSGGAGAPPLLCISAGNICGTGKFPAPALTGRRGCPAHTRPPGRESTSAPARWYRAASAPPPCRRPLPFDIAGNRSPPAGNIPSAG